MSATATPTRPKKKKPTRQKSVDAATAYARAVVAGEIVACRAVRQTCQRHLDDLAKQQTPDFPYVYDEQAAAHIIAFFPEFLTLEDGRPFELPPWLQFCYGVIFGWKRISDGLRRFQCDGLRRFQYGFVETSKGSGKSPSAAGIGLYGMTFDDEPYAEIYSAAFDKEQASIILNDAIRMGKASEELSAMLQIDKYNIANLENGSFFRAVSSEHRGKSGPRPSMILGDEIHEHRDGRVINKLTAGFKGREQPLALLYTNSGSDKTSICWEYHQKSLQVLEGSIVDEQWFAYVCHLDPCEACYAEGYRQPKDGCDQCDDWTNPAVWPKVAPALGIVIQPKYLQDAVDTARTIPSEFALKRRLNFCIWTETHQVWIPPDKWDACKVPAVSQSNPGLAAAAAGLDPASTMDLAACVVALRIDDPPSAEKPETVEIEGQNELGAQIKLVFTLNFTVELIPFFWMPRATQNERVQHERIPFDVWERAGHLFTTPGPAIDHQAIYQCIISDLWKRYRLQRIGMDENGGRYLFAKLRDDGRLGDQVVSVGQGKKLSEAFKFIEILIAHKRLRHAGNPVLTWCFANAEPHRDARTGAMWIEKPEEKKRIDGAVAAAMAVSQLMVLRPRRASVGVMVL